MFHTREQVIQALERCPHPGVRRAVDEGTVEFLGAFDVNPSGPVKYVAYICTVTSVHSTVWNAVITPHKFNRGFGFRLAEPVPWNLWMDSPDWAAGDKPEEYRIRKEQNEVETSNPRPS